MWYGNYNSYNFIQSVYIAASEPENLIFNIMLLLVPKQLLNIQINITLRSASKAS